MRRTSLAVIIAFVLFMGSGVRFVTAEPGDDALQKERVDLQATLGAKREEATVTVAAKKEEVLQKIEDVVKESKDRYVKHLESLISHLSLIRTHVSERVYLTDEQKQEIYSEVDTLSSRLDEVKLMVEEAKSRDDVHVIKDTMSSLWHEARLVRNRAVGYILVGRYQEHVNKAEEVVVRIQNRIEAIQDEDVDVSGVTDALSAFSSELSIAKQSIARAKTTFETMSEGQEFETGIGLLAQSRDDLYIAGGLLKKAVESLITITQ